MSESGKMTLRLDKLTDAELEQFDKGSVVVMKVMREMTDDEFSKFNVRVSSLSEQFRKRGVFLVISPAWLDFVVVKEGEKIERKEPV